MLRRAGPLRSGSLTDTRRIVSPHVQGEDGLSVIGFIGLGTMGAPMARNLLKAGHELRVFDVSTDARAALAADGATEDNVLYAIWSANTDTTYIREDGWRPGGRMKQYLGGHDEKYGNVTINIDTNYLDLGTTSPTGDARCAGTRMSFRSYPTITPDRKPRNRVRALLCVLKEQGHWDGKIHGRYGPKVRRAVAAWQTSQGLTPSTTVDAGQWVRLLSAGDRPALKRGSAGVAVHRVQQALVAAGYRSTRSTGVFDAATHQQVRAYQARRKGKAHGVVNPRMWKALASGAR